MNGTFYVGPGANANQVIFADLDPASTARKCFRVFNTGSEALKVVLSQDGVSQPARSESLPPGNSIDVNTPFLRIDPGSGASVARGIYVQIPE